MRNMTAAWRALGSRAPMTDEAALAASRPSSMRDDEWTVYRADVAAPLTALIRALDPVVVGLSGPPGSGKTTLARCAAALLGPRALQLSMDDAYLSKAQRDARGLRFRGGAGSHDLAALIRVLDDVRKGRAPITIPRYDTHADDRGPSETFEDAPRPLILEGYFLGYRGDGYGHVADLLDVLVFIDVDVSTARARRFEREADLRERGGGLSETDMQRFWDDVLSPGVAMLIPAAKAEADVVMTIDASQRVRSVFVREERPDLIAVLTERNWSDLR